MRASFVAIAFLAACSDRRAPEPWIEASELAELRSASSKGGEYLAQGEGARLRGDDERALELYAKAGVEFKSRDHGRRFECLLLSERGKRAEALRACEQASNVRNSSAARRAQVGAQMAGDAPVELLELARAKAVADALLAESTQSPYGYAALCDIARKLGDDQMLSLYFDQLRTVAPTHAETRRLERLLAARVPSRAFYVGWALLALLLLGTAAHALRRLLRRVAPRAAATAALFVLTLSTGSLRAEPVAQLSEWAIDDADPMASIPPLQQLNINPLQAGYLLMDLGERADRAEKAGQYVTAAKYYLAIAKMVPDRATGLAKACAAYQAAGELADALAACALALARPGVRVEDYLRYSELIFAGSEPLTPEELTDLGAVVQHLRENGQPGAAERIQCEIGFRLDDKKRLGECSAALVKIAPDDPKTVSYQWSLALLERDHGQAQRLIARARKLGVQAEVLQKMEYVTAATIPIWRRPSVLLAVLAALTLIGGIVVVLRKNGRRSPPASLGTSSASPGGAAPNTLTSAP